MSKRYVLFYSKRCEFCTDVMKELEKANLMSHIHTLSIEGSKSIPKCITNVPTLYVSKHKKYIGGDIYSWMHSILSPSVEVPAQVEIPKEVLSVDSNPQFSSGYTYLTQDEENSEFIEHKYTLIANSAQTIKTVDEDNTAPSMKCSAADYEAYLKKRDLDMKRK